MPALGHVETVFCLPRDASAFSKTVTGQPLPPELCRELKVGQWVYETWVQRRYEEWREREDASEVIDEPVARPVRLVQPEEPRPVQARPAELTILSPTTALPDKPDQPPDPRQDSGIVA